MNADKSNNGKQIVIKALTTLFNEKKCDQATIRRYFTETYVQYVNEKIVDFEDILHNLALRIAKYQKVHISFKEAFSEDNKICTIHVLEAVTPDGKTITTQGNAVFYIENGKIAKCIELTRLIENLNNDLFLSSH